MLDAQIPEIKRVAIYVSYLILINQNHLFQDVCLNAKMFAPRDVKVKDFLKKAPDPPEEEAVSRSLEFLEVIFIKLTKK